MTTPLPAPAPMPACADLTASALRPDRPFDPESPARLLTPRPGWPIQRVSAPQGQHAGA